MWQNESMEVDAAVFRALGDPTRLQILRFLSQKCGPVAVDEEGQVRPVAGATVGEVCCHVTGSPQATSTISFHLKELRLAGLIHAEKAGKFMICSIRPEAIRSVVQFLSSFHEAQP